jgi:hypothetical protein
VAIFDALEAQMIREGLANGWNDDRFNIAKMPLSRFPFSTLLFWCVCRNIWSRPTGARQLTRRE